MCKKPTLDEVEELFNFLQGQDFKSITKIDKPNLTADQAFSVIYVLQEGLGIIPDTYEKCSKCDTLFDSDSGGDNSESLIDVFIEAYGEDNNVKIPDKLWDTIRHKKGLPFEHYCEGCRDTNASILQDKVNSIIEKELSDYPKKTEGEQDDR